MGTLAAAEPGTRRYGENMTLEFSGEVWYWRGPAPHHFVSVPAEQCADLSAASKLVTYGWGMIPVRARIGETEWKTSLFAKDGGYVVPLRATVRKAEGFAEGDTVTVTLSL